ncbi:hypothetical protein EYF80_008053 [Liparis tanakae]|uniref:Uncharacterized protein n=1 Tax=Liparis tanakae TaxID=230148 RepID=A0A4Z2IV37_9TELE|nr:hypothetical protein EYF80_008053 [Liparis tanakae]
MEERGEDRRRKCNEESQWGRKHVNRQPTFRENWFSTSSVSPRKSPEAEDKRESRLSSSVFSVILKPFCCLVRSLHADHGGQQLVLQTVSGHGEIDQGALGLQLRLKRTKNRIHCFPHVLYQNHVPCCQRSLHGFQVPEDETAASLRQHLNPEMSMSSSHVTPLTLSVPCG